MAIITEDYVSFEIAKLLKEKGFDEPCFAYYSEYWDNWKSLRLWRKFPKRNVSNKGYLNVPTLQMAMKWLREAHNIFIYPMVGEIDGKTWYDADIIPINGKVIYWKALDVLPPAIEYNTPEEACEAAIKYCIENLI